MGITKGTRRQRFSPGTPPLPRRSLLTAGKLVVAYGFDTATSCDGPPKSMDVKTLDTTLFSHLTETATHSPRGRAHHTLHSTAADAVQRMCVAINPGSYIQPHRHSTPAKWELFLIIKGSASILIFDDKATVSARIDLNAKGPSHACEIPPHTWHTLVAHAKGTILTEIKPGPYTPLLESEFADWAPREGENSAQQFESFFRTAQTGACFTK